jgi:hypothetical protein
MRTSSRFHAAALVVLTALTIIGTLGTALGTQKALAADDFSWAVRTESNGFGPDRDNYNYAVTPGQEIKDGLVVVNHGSEPLDLVAYAADGFTTRSGQLDLLTSDKASIGVGAWVTMANSTVHLEPNASATVAFTVRVPDNAPPGDYMGGVLTSLSRPDHGEGINVDQRLGIRLHLRVGGELKPQLAVENLKVRYQGTANPFGTGAATVTYTVHNRGNAIVSARQAVALTGPLGKPRIEASAIDDTPQLLPGESWDVSVPIDGAYPAVRLDASVTLRPMLTDVSGSTVPLDPVERTAATWALPWSWLVSLVVLVGLAVVGLRLRSRARALRKGRENARVQEAVEQALREATS